MNGLKSWFSYTYELKTTTTTPGIALIQIIYI